MEKETLGFVMYKDYREYLGFLSKEEKADVLESVFDYAFCGNECDSSMPAVARLAFAVIRNQIDRDREKYEKKCEQNRKNGALGGRPRTDACDSPSSQNRNAKEDEDRSERSDTALDESFRRFWQQYPKKLCEGDAYLAFKRLSPDEGLFERMLDALSVFKVSDQWTSEQGRYVPKAAAWIDSRRWEEIPETAEKKSGSFDTDDFFEAALLRESQMFDE